MTAERERARADDLEARRLALEVFDRPLVVEAGAGSGKTAVLVGRLVVWSLGPGWERANERLGPGVGTDAVAQQVLGGVVAVTFTEAAAAEMAERVARALGDAASGRLPLGVPEGLVGPHAQARAKVLLAARDQLSISTIHAFARRLLARWPLEAGVHPRFAVDGDGSRWQAAVVEATRELAAGWWGTEAGSGNPDVVALAVRGFGPREIAEAATALASEGAAAAELAALEPGEHLLLGDLVAALDLLVATARSGLARAGQARANRTRIRGAGDLLFGVAELAAHARSATTLEQVVAPLARLADAERRRLNSWARSDFTAAEADAFGERSGEVAEAAGKVAVVVRQCSRHDPGFIAAAARVLASVLDLAQRRTNAAGVVRFADLVPRVRRLLAQRPGIVARLRREIDQLLVDELQDTDESQCAMLETLTLGPGARPGLFAVGDPKQSIYGWRAADLAAYDSFVDTVVAHGGRRLRLLANYRSVPDILNAVERLVAPIMIRRRGVQPQFEPLLAQRVNNTEVAPPRRPVERWRVTDPTGGRLSSRLATQREAVVLAEELASLLRGGVEPERVAVLVRTTSDLPTYLRALRSARVPYAVAREREWGRRREVIEAGCVVRLVLDPADELALVAVLRSPLVGVADRALEPLLAGGLARLFRALGRGDSTIAVVAVGELGSRELEGAEASALTALALEVDGLRRHLDLWPADQFVAALRARMALDVLEASRPLGAWRVAAIERLLGMVHDQLLEGAGPVEVAARVRALGSGSALEDQGLAEPTLVPGAVRILTVHAAKGLDFDHVFVLQVHKEPARRSAPRATRAQHDESGQRHWTLLGVPSALAHRAEEAEAATAAAERVRLLYVALTRARERLVILGRPSATAGASRSAAWSFADLLAHDPIEAGVGDDTIAVCDRVPTDELVPTTDVDPAFTAWPDLARGLAQEVARREASRRRMARRYLGSPSHHQGGPADPPTSLGPVRTDRLAVGSAFHRALERVVVTRALAVGLGPALVEVLPGVVEGLETTAVVELEALLATFAAGPLGTRWLALAPRMLARELPFLASPDPDRGPVGVLTGTIDLVAELPGGGVLVVDFKTDAVVGASSARRRAAEYAAQVETYAKALAEALDLTTAPRVELWFVRCGEVVAHAGRDRDTLSHEEDKHDLPKLS